MSDPMPPGGTKGKGPLGKLNPKQKRMVAIAGVAALLALIYLLTRKRSGEAAERREPTETEGVASGPFGGPVGSAGGENAAALSEIGENLGGELGVLGEQQGLTQQLLGEQGAELAGIGQQIGDLRSGQEERDERWLGGQSEQTAQLKAINKHLEHGSPHAKGKKGGGRKHHPTVPAKHHKAPKGGSHPHSHPKPHPKPHPHRHR